MTTYTFLIQKLPGLNMRGRASWLGVEEKTVGSSYRKHVRKPQPLNPLDFRLLHLFASV